MLNFLQEHFYTIVYIWIGIAVIVFPFALMITAPYGRHSKKISLMLPAKWGWVLMELPSPLIFSYFVLSGENSVFSVVGVFFILFNLHYFHRTLIWPFMMRSKGKEMPLLIAFSALGFNIMNGSINGYLLGFLANYEMSWLSDSRFLIGLGLFIVGSAINVWHDYHLISLRKDGSTGYKIPNGGLFKFVSSPNLFGEIIEWTGWALMTWSIPTLSFAIWTWANLLPRALDHHRWYRNYFDEYPKDRKAVIPFVL